MWYTVALIKQWQGQKLWKTDKNGAMYILKLKGARAPRT